MEETPKYNPREAQRWSAPERSHVAKCKDCELDPNIASDGLLFSSSDEHWVFEQARNHCAINRHTVRIVSTITITVSPPSDAA